MLLDIGSGTTLSRILWRLVIALTLTTRHAKSEMRSAASQNGLTPISYSDPMGTMGLLGRILLSRAAVVYLLTNGFETILWNSVPGDWKDTAGWVDTCISQVLENDWSVVVLHDIEQGCLPRLPELLRRLNDFGVVYEQDYPDSVVLTRAGNSSTWKLDTSATNPTAARRRVLHRKFQSWREQWQEYRMRRVTAQGQSPKLFLIGLSRNAENRSKTYLQRLRTFPMFVKRSCTWRRRCGSRPVIDRRFRELAVLTVGLETKSEYEFEHHWNSAVKAGVSHEQLLHLAEFETSLFDDRERAIMRYARQVTLQGEVTDFRLGRALHLPRSPTTHGSLVGTVAWYNCVVRILLPLRIEKEDWFVRL